MEFFDKFLDLRRYMVAVESHHKTLTLRLSALFFVTYHPKAYDTSVLEVLLVKIRKEEMQQVGDLPIQIVPDGVCFRHSHLTKLSPATRRIVTESWRQAVPAVSKDR